MQRLQALISGTVQGVGFRDAFRRKALQLGLTGYVRNLPDGRVEALVEGQDDDLRALLSFARTGISSALVSHIDASWQTADNSFSDFSIRY